MITSKLMWVYRRINKGFFVGLNISPKDLREKKDDFSKYQMIWKKDGDFLQVIPIPGEKN